MVYSPYLLIDSFIRQFLGLQNASAIFPLYYSSQPPPSLHRQHGACWLQDIALTLKPWLKQKSPLLTTHLGTLHAFLQVQLKMHFSVHVQMISFCPGYTDPSLKYHTSL